MKVSILKITEVYWHFIIPGKMFSFELHLNRRQGDFEEVRRRLKEAPGDESFEYDFMEPACTARAMAALQADPRLQVLEEQIRRKILFVTPRIMECAGASAQAGAQPHQGGDILAKLLLQVRCPSLGRPRAAPSSWQLLAP